MASVPVNTTFSPGTTITSGWLNGVNDHANSIYPINHPATNISLQPVPGLTAQTVQQAFDEIVGFSGWAPINSPAFTGTPTAPTQLDTDDSTRLATTAFVHNLVDSDKVVNQTSNTGAIITPKGTTAERDLFPASGYLRFNTQDVSWEGWNGVFWTSIGGGQMYGTAQVKSIFYNNQIISEDVTIKSNTNGGTFGPITVSDGFTVTVEDNATWSIV